MPRPTVGGCEPDSRVGAGGPMPPERPMRPSSARVGRGNAPVDVEQVAGALARARGGGEVQDRLCDVLREDVDLERGALAVVLLQLVGLDPVGGGALLAP